MEMYFVGWLRRLKLSGRVALYPFALFGLLTAATSANAYLYTDTFTLNFVGTGVSATAAFTAGFNQNIATDCGISACDGAGESLVGTLTVGTVNYAITLLAPGSICNTGGSAATCVTGTNDNSISYSPLFAFGALPDGDGIGFSVGGVNFDLIDPSLCSATTGCTSLTSYSLTPSAVSAVSAVPLPAALPLFATGLGALGLLGWRRKRKLAAIAA